MKDTADHQANTGSMVGLFFHGKLVLAIGGGYTFISLLVILAVTPLDFLLNATFRKCEIDYSMNIFHKRQAIMKHLFECCL